MPAVRQPVGYLLNLGPNFYTSGIATINLPVCSAPYQNNLANSPIYLSYVPKTAAERAASGDPRPSVEERYPSFGQYHSAVMRAIDGLVKDRLMLCEDADDAQARLLAAGLTAGVPAAQGKLPPKATVPHCLGAKR